MYYIKIEKWAVVPGDTEEEARAAWEDCIEETLSEQALEFVKQLPPEVAEDCS